MRTYLELLNKARDLFAEEVEHDSDLRDFMKRGPDFSDEDREYWKNNKLHVIEQVTWGALPYDAPDATILALLREQPSLLSFDGYQRYDTIREFAIDLVRYQVELELTGELNLSHPDENVPGPSRGPVP